MENKSSINVKAIYDSVGTDIRVLDTVTKLNYYILNFIYNILYSNDDINLEIIEPIFKFWCISVKQVEQAEEKELYNDMVQYLEKTSNDISNNFSGVSTIAYFVGTHTESSEPLTVTTLTALVCAILKKLDINLIFN